ncbi:hypothetical protein GIR22_16645 [Pseudomonas sp. CCM 7891]|uniref:Lipocalin-like domain-containing protein n=1 Tax=Pseudomonas karstica TaxID=1055468 RepID=A0A7X2V008_9PSED|nr:lipocalin-like domain-containing protein [Pseudomonas karstica]MTD20757.1 hypothetical protein [Pseudomonas karstica]
MPNENFIGVWQLIDYVVQMEDGTCLMPLGSTPYGVGIYTPDGWMSAHLMRNDRTPLGGKKPGVDAIPADILSLMVSGYIGYAGRYTVDHNAATVTHHVETALLPDWVGTKMVREFCFEREILVLRPPQVGGAASVLRWRRAS